MEKKKKEKSHNSLAVDSAIQNLMRCDDDILDKDMVNCKNCGSFERINTPVSGIEVDVDEL